MNGLELLEQRLRQGVAVWRIEEELDWQENQAARCDDCDRQARHVPVDTRIRNRAPQALAAVVYPGRR